MKEQNAQFTLLLKNTRKVLKTAEMSSIII